MKTKTFKGFFFVLISFILISYIFLYFTAWINAMEISEKVSSEKFRAVSLEGLTAQLTQEKFMKFFDISGNYALFKINEYSSNSSHTMKYDINRELFYLNRTFFSVITNGSSNDFENEALNYSDSEYGVYTFYAWLKNLNSTLSQAGLEIKLFNITNMNFNQIDIVTFNATINISIFISDNLSMISINRTFHLEKNFSIEGFPDPMIKREYAKIDSSSNIEKRIYVNDTLLKLDIKNIINGTQGQGFFYGPLINTTDSINSNIALKGQYILVGTYDEIISVPDYLQFGAYILTNQPIEISTSCPNRNEDKTFMAITYNSSQACALKIKNNVNQPFAVIKDFDIKKFSGPNSEYHALIIANHSTEEVKNNVSKKNYNVSAYDIENLRDATICAYFIPSTRAPSYAQRLSADALSLKSPNGMESFLVGRWAGGENLATGKKMYENSSRVDWEFFNTTIKGIKIRGMPGCKTFSMCSTGVGIDAPLGHFRFSSDSLSFYKIMDIACNDGRARCNT